MHGSLICSNYGIDGRLLDFGTTTAVKDYARVCVAPGGRDFWSQHLSVLETITDLHHYLRRFLPPSAARALVQSDQLKSDFLTALHLQQQRQMPLLAGFSESMVDRFEEGLSERISRAMFSVVCSGNIRPVLYYGDDRHTMPGDCGRHQLTNVLRGGALCRTPSEMDKASESFIADRSVREELCSAIFAGRDAVLSALPVGERRRREMEITLRGLRANWDLSPLWRRNLDGKIDSVCRNPYSVRDFIEEMLLYWNAVLGERGELRLDPWLTDMSAYIDIEGRICRDVDGREVEPSALAHSRLNLDNLEMERFTRLVLLIGGTAA